MTTLTQEECLVLARQCCAWEPLDIDGLLLDGLLEGDIVFTPSQLWSFARVVYQVALDEVSEE
jgi:hypothetical protein